MNIRSLCLAILHDGPASGYEIRKLSVEGEYSYFVEASFGAIYPALAKLEEEGLVTSHVEAHPGRPSKKVYAVTDNGRQEFIDSLFEDLSEDVFRSEFLLFARFAPSLPQSLVKTRLLQRIQSLDEQLTHFNQLLQDRNHPGDQWVIRYGLSCVTVAKEYLTSHMAELVAMARPDEPATKAAE